MTDKPKEIWCDTGLYWDYKRDWSEGSWQDNDDCGGEKYVRADCIEALEAERDSLAEQLAATKEKLEKVVEALREAETAPEPDHHVPQFRHVMDVIGATLAQITGETDG